MGNETLDELLSGEEPQEREDHNRSKFNPKFNVREEFTLWVREQFPELKEHTDQNLAYEEVETRREEIYQAALGAVNHGVASTEACAKSLLRLGWQEFEKGFALNGNPAERTKSFEKFTTALEKLSISLGGEKHYTEAGTFLSGGSWYKKNAFIYRTEKEDGKKTEYVVFAEAQPSGGADAPVLIGEFIKLSQWQFEDLQKIAAKFKGAEDDFIDEVDKKIYQEETYRERYRESQAAYTSNTGLGAFFQNVYKKFM